MDATVKVNTADYIKNLGMLSVIVGAAAAQVAAEAKQSLQPHGEHIFYPDHGHWSSPPGTPPNTDLGNLWESIKPKMTGPTEAEVRVHSEYGLPLELGTSTMAARPFMKPALDKVKPSFVKAVRRVASF